MISKFLQILEFQKFFSITRTIFSHSTKYHFFFILGYADSSPITPSKTGVVQDALKVYEYAKSLAKETPIIVYGHSLGTAVSTEAVAQLCEQGDPPKALILG